MKKLMTLTLAVIMLLTACMAAAETKLTVTGNGETRISADTAVISLGVSARDKNVLKAQQQVNEAIAAIRKALIGLGVSEENITTDYISIGAVYDYSFDLARLTAYSATTTLAVKVTDIDKVGTLIDAAFASGANDLNGITFSASDTEQAKAESLKMAVENAKAKAEILAEAAGLRITGIEVISEGGVYSYSNTVGNVYARDLKMDEAYVDAGTVVQAAKLIVSASVSITFTAE
ncbi:MAG: SIMPL domain-containing protein [Clostridia bacterium]|nr:SIMPL domain-containing protein [Clostridia bacterium]